MIRNAALAIFLFATGITADCQDTFIVRKDLKADWQIFTGESYQVFNEDESVKTIYVGISAKTYHGDYLILTSDFPFSVMVNGKLILDRALNAALPIDSLSTIVSASGLFFAIHWEEERSEERRVGKG